MFVGGQVISMPRSTQRLCTASTSSTHIDIQTPFSSASFELGLNCIGKPVLPRPPCPPSQRKISDLSQQTPPNVGGLPQSQPFCQPSFSNHSKLCLMLETFKIGVRRSTFMAPVAP